ncbi:MAG: FtsQ-type POTRA domain-containing protein [Candidatus Cloacimonadaceae bacterium]
MPNKTRKRRGNSRFVFFFILILIVLFSGSVFGYHQLRKASWLNLKDIGISGNENVSTTTLLDLLNEYIGVNLLEISAQDISEQLMKIKRIEKVRMVRQYPSTLKIKVTERKGFLYIKSAEGNLFPIDEHGMVMEYAVSPSKEDLPIVHTKFHSNHLHAGTFVKDPLVQRVIDLQKQIIAEKPDFLSSISEYYEHNKHIVIIDAKHGSGILLGTDNLKDQLRRYQFVQENGNINRKNFIDLRFKDQVVVRSEVQ